MGKRFKVGDHVTWNSEAGHVSGTIIKVHTKDFDYKGHTHHASEDDPQYEIKSGKTDHIAMHKGHALKKASAERLLISFGATLVFVFEQITEHFCIQGWSGVAKWGGVPMRDILDIVKPTAGCALRCVLLVLRRFRRWRLLRRSRDSQYAASIDHPRLRNERGAGQRPPWRAAAAALRERIRLQDGQVDRGDRVCPTISPTLAPAKAAITKITSSMDTVCRFEARGMGAQHPSRQSRSAPTVLTPTCARRSKDQSGEFE